MSEAPPDFQLLARRYLDLWQEQVAAMAGDPALAEAVARGITLMTQVPAAFVQAATAGATSQPLEDRTNDAPTANVSSSASAPPGAAPAAAASADPSVDLGRIARRLAALEERLAALEAGTGAAGGTIAAKPGRSRTRRLDKA